MQFQRFTFQVSRCINASAARQQTIVAGTRVSEIEILVDGAKARPQPGVFRGPEGPRFRKNNERTIFQSVFQNRDLRARPGEQNRGPSL